MVPLRQPQSALDRGMPIGVKTSPFQATLQAVAWVIAERGGPANPPEVVVSWNRDVHYPRPTAGTIESATRIQTPSQAEHGLEGVLFCEMNKTNISGLSPIWES